MTPVLIVLGLALWLALLLGVAGVCASAKRGDRALARHRSLQDATARVVHTGARPRPPAG